MYLLNQDCSPYEADKLSSYNHQDGTRLDIAGIRATHERTLFDVRVFNPHAPWKRHISPLFCYRRHEQVKKGMYEKDAEGWNMPSLR